jgi:hypothetical protein
MKRKIRIIDQNNKVIEKEFKVRDLELLEARQKHKAQVFIPKKGKGSFKRNKKVNPEEF